MRPLDTATHRRLLCLLALAALLLPLHGLQAQSFPPEEEVGRILEKRVEIGRNPGIVAGLLEDGRATILTAGTSGREGVALDGNTVMEIGSATKVLTAVVLQDMVSRGEVRLDQPVGELLPEGVTVPVDPEGREITLLDLSVHRSALPRMPSNFSPADPANPYADYTVAQMYEFLSGYELPRGIGEEWEYSNFAVGLLGHVLALRAGTSFEELLRERIFEPLGMDDTAIELPGRLQARLAQGHDATGAPAPNWDIPTLAGAGGVRSTANDMLRFLEANLPSAEGELAPVLEKTHVVRGSLPEDEAEGQSMALGWVVNHRFEDRPLHWHNGGTGGYRFFMAIDKVGERAVVLLTNASVSVDDIGFHLLDPRHDLAPPEPYVEPTVVEVDSTVLSRYVGEYEVGPEFVLDVTLEDGQLFLQATGQGKLALQPESETAFFVRGVEARVSFVLDDGGEVTGLVVHQGGGETPATRRR